MPYEDRTAFRLVFDQFAADYFWGGDNNRSGLVESIEGCEAGPRHRGEDQHYGGRPLQVGHHKAPLF